MKGVFMIKKTNKPPVYTARKVNKGLTVLGICAVMAGSGLSGAAGAYIYLNGAEKENGTAISTPIQQVNTVTTSDLSEVVEHCKQSVVEITTESASNGNHIFQQYIQEGAGSGVIISEDGYILTNDHVISGASTIKVTLQDGTEYDGHVIGTDSVSDVAVLKIEANGLVPATVGNSSDLKVGETTIVIGNPLGSLGGTVTTGIISALNREIEVNGEMMTLLQTDAAVNPGNSGGGLFNASGELVGIVNAKTSSEGVEGLGFAIPIDEAMNVASQLMDTGSVSNRAALNITLADYGSSVVVASVIEGGAAEQAGIESGDQIISIDGEEVHSSSEVKKIIRAHVAGDSVEVIVARNGKFIPLTVTFAQA